MKKLKLNKIKQNCFSKKIEGLLKVLIVGIALILPMHELVSLADDTIVGSAFLLNGSEGASATNVLGPQPGESVPFPDYEKDSLARQGKSSRFLDRIKLEISANEDDLLKINGNLHDTAGRIEHAQEQIVSLQDQLDILDAKIQNSVDTIENVVVQIKKKEIDIKTLQYQILQKKTEISFQKQMLAEYLKDIFIDRANFNNLNDDNGELNTLKLLLSEGSTADNLRALRYSEVLESKGRDIFEKLDILVDEQETDSKILMIRERTLQIYNNKLLAQKIELEVEKQGKANLLVQTQGEESVFQQLLKQNQAEQEDMLLQMDTLRKNMAFVQDRMRTLGDQFNPDDYANLLNISSGKNLRDFLTNSSANGQEFAPRWPVNPIRGISAYFRDSGYAKVFGMRHNAIDIPIAQSTPLRAPADGFVYKVKDNGYGYSFIMLAHANGYMTLYGHVSDILVSAGQQIEAGDVIGLSGATPGTRGAGIYTTGAHLHFEVFKNGEFVDPLNYLNLAYLRLDSLPEKYVSKALGDRQKVRRMPAKVRVKKEIEPLQIYNDDGSVSITMDSAESSNYGPDSINLDLIVDPIDGSFVFQQ